MVATLHNIALIAMVAILQPPPYIEDVQEWTHTHTWRV